MHICIINGWAMPSSVWRGFCELLASKASYASCKIIDIDRGLSVDQWMQYLDEIIEPNTLLVGWSLGGMLATEYAYQNPAKLRALCSLQMNPKFVAADGWACAMPREVFDEFKQMTVSDEKSDVNNLIKRFSFLVTTKGLDSIADLRALKSSFSVDLIPPIGVLRQSLELLASIDVRAKLSVIKVPQLHLLGEYDQLVPCSVARHIKQLNSRAHVELIDGISHFPCYSAAESIVAPIAEFVGGLN